jgi:hypothetical protein
MYSMTVMPIVYFYIDFSTEHGGRLGINAASLFERLDSLP